MASKSALKQIREKIDGNDNKGALKLVEDQIKANVVDYTLLLFAGFANKNLKNLEESARFYRKAIDIAPGQLPAWQGLYEVITDPEWKDAIDDFYLSVVNKLIEKTTNPEKLPVYKKARVRFFLALEKYEEILASEDFSAYFTDKDACLKGIQKVNNNLKKTGAEQLTKELLARIDLDGIQDANNHFLLCGLHLKLSPYTDYSKWIISHIRQFPEVSSPLIVHQSFCILAHELLRSSLSLAPNLRELSSLCFRLQSSPPHFSQKISKFFSSANLNAAFDFINSCPAEDYQLWPDLGLVLFTFRELGQFCRISKLLKSISISATVPSLDHLAIWSLKIESDFQIADSNTEFESILEDLNSPEVNYKNSKQLWSWKLKEIYTKCLILTAKLNTAPELDSLLTELYGGEEVHSMLHLKATTTSMEEDPDNEPTDCRNVLLYVRILMAKGQRQVANSQLVSAAQKNAYNADVFHLLALNLLASGTDLEKAKACAQRALLFNPSSEGTAKVLQELYAKQNVDNNIRLNSLVSFLAERPASEWGLKQAALLEINLGKLDQAVEKIQRLVRIKTTASSNRIVDRENEEMCALWIFLSEAYKQKGNLQSAVRACKTALDIEPMHYSATLQLIQLHQGMGHYLEAIELGTSLLSSPCLSPNIQSFLQLIHTHSLVLYVTDENSNRSVQEQRQHLPQLFELFAKLWKGSSNCVLLQKMVAQTMNVLLRFNQPTIAECIDQLNLTQFPLPINCKVDVYKCIIGCLSCILQSRPSSSDVWNDLAMAFLGLFPTPIRGNKAIRKMQRMLKKRNCVHHMQTKEVRILVQHGKSLFGRKITQRLSIVLSEP